MNIQDNYSQIVDEGQIVFQYLDYTYWVETNKKEHLSFRCLFQATNKYKYEVQYDIRFFLGRWVGSLLYFKEERRQTNMLAKGEYIIVLHA